MWVGENGRILDGVLEVFQIYFLIAIKNAAAAR
jgi:hypothetical protein